MSRGCHADFAPSLWGSAGRCATITAMPRLRLRGLAFLCLPSFAASPALAAEVKVSGLIFADYAAVTSRFLSNGERARGRNEFDVSRIYLNAGSSFDEHLGGFLQFEANLVSREPLSSGSTNQVYLKQAYLEYREVYPGAKLQFGLVGTPWRAFEEGIWKHRFVAKILDDEEGLAPASDRGVRLSGAVPRVAYDLMAGNGEGTGARGTSGNEPNKYKDVTGKISVSPFASESLKGLKVNVLYQRGQKVAGWVRDRAYGGLSYESSRFNLMGAYYSSRDGKSVATGTDTVKGAGFSMHTVIPVSQRSWVFARWDRWDPDRLALHDARSRWILGAGHAPAEGVRVALDYQGLIQQKQTATRKDQGSASLHVEVRF